MITEYDIFISYKTRRYANEAKDIKHALENQGYSVWFDEAVLDKKDYYPKEQLCDILIAAVKQCKCSVIFEAELERVVLLPGTSIEEEIKKQTIMLTEQGPIDWNWQKLEIDASTKVIAIHSSPRMVYVFDYGIEVSDKIGITNEPYTNSSILLQRILQALDYFGIAPKTEI